MSMVWTLIFKNPLLGLANVKWGGGISSIPIPSSSIHQEPMSVKNRWLVADEPVEFKKQPVEVQDFRRFTAHFRGIYRINLK